MNRLFNLIGVLNLTPDSFSDGGQFFSVDLALKHVERLIAEGADFIDVGAETSKPGSDPISIEIEMQRLRPFLSQYRTYFDCPLSLDTYKAEVAQWGIDLGVNWINDISGLSDPQMINVIANTGVGIMVMHMQGNPKTMQDNPVYTDVVDDVYSFLLHQVSRCRDRHIQQIMIDPGIGFGKRTAHNLCIFNQLSRFQSIGVPVMIGPSRKSFIGQLTGAAITDRLPGTIASVLHAYSQGITVFRVHDVAQVRQALTVWDAMAQPATMNQVSKQLETQ